MTTVLVTNISPALEEHHLVELFECCGPMKNLNLKSSEPRACTIEFNEPAHAQAAVLLSGTPLGDRKLQVQIKDGDGSASPGSQISALGGVSGLLSGIGGLVPSLSQDFNNPAQNAANMAAQSMNLSWPLMAAAQKRQEEVARTIYVGNLGFDIDCETLRKFFSSCGEISYCKIVGDSVQVGWTGRFAFIEFKDQEGANTAITLTGTMLGDRAIKVGRSNNPIIKQGGSGPADVKDGKSKSIDEIMAKVREATREISEKVVESDRSRSRSRSRRRKKRRGSRSRSRGSRSRSRRRGSRRSRRRSRSRGRTPPRRRSPRGPPPKKKEQIDRTGMFFDGYAWQPLDEVARKIPGAVVMAQYSTSIRK